jgi:hypothetical protein
MLCLIRVRREGCFLQNQCCGTGMFLSRIRFFPSWIQSQKDSGSRIRIRVKQFKYLFLALKTVSRLSEKWSGIFIQDPDFFPSRIQGSKKHRSRVSGPDPQRCAKFATFFQFSQETLAKLSLLRQQKCSSHYKIQKFWQNVVAVQIYFCDRYAFALSCDEQTPVTIMSFSVEFNFYPLFFPQVLTWTL